MPSGIEQLSGLSKSSVVDTNVDSIARQRGVGIAQWLASLNERRCGLIDLALGWYRVMNRMRSWVKSVVF